MTWGALVLLNPVVTGAVLAPADPNHLAILPLAAIATMSPWVTACPVSTVNDCPTLGCSAGVGRSAKVMPRTPLTVAFEIVTLLSWSILLENAVF